MVNLGCDEWTTIEMTPQQGGEKEILNLMKDCENYRITGLIN